MADELSRMTVLECGAGCGLVGLAAALLGARQVVLSDLPIALATLSSNAASNGFTVVPDKVRSAGDGGTGATDEIEVEPLDWRAECQPLLDDGRTFDLVLASECVYDEDMVLPLLKICHRACGQSGVLLLSGIIGGAAVDELRRQWPLYFNSCVALEGDDGLGTPPVSRAIHRVTGPRSTVGACVTS
eukprot:3670899-Prymnesium_polylepis.1